MRYIQPSAQGLDPSRAASPKGERISVGTHRNHGGGEVGSRVHLHVDAFLVDVPEEGPKGVAHRAHRLLVVNHPPTQFTIISRDWRGREGG